MILIGILLFAWVQGITDAILYSRQAADALKTNEHVYLVTQRVLVALMALNGFIYGLNNLPVMVAASEVFAGALIFSYIHNGTYYVYRDKIQGSRYGFKHKSPTTTAKIDFSYKQRSLLAIIGLVLIILVYAWYIFK